MDYKPYDRFSVPITTGVPRAPQPTPAVKSGEAANTPSFGDILRNQLSASNVEFSKHAVSRVLERNIPISPANMQRLNSGVELAREK
ncbi:MAG: hypothetical protein RR209_02645, partial [Angelakisella sp.]